LDKEEKKKTMKIVKTIVKETWINEETIHEFCKKSNGFFIRYNYYGMHYDSITKEEYDTLVETFVGKIITDKDDYQTNHYVIGHIESYWGNKYGGTIQVGGLQSSIEYGTYKELKTRFPKIEQKKTLNEGF
jgi:hypothetical protein